MVSGWVGVIAFTRTGKTEGVKATGLKGRRLHGRSPAAGDPNPSLIMTRVGG